MKRIIPFLIFIFSLFALGGCQSAEKTNSVPFSNGPTASPHVDGPKKAPPSEQPSAMSEEESGSFTLQTTP